MSRPRRKIDSKQVYKLACLGATHGEIAEFFDCERSTISKRFSPEITKAKAQLKMKLRRLQLRAAEQGNVTMLIWLGKVMLGQTEVEVNDQSRINVIVDC
jgi:hypothetical protein